MHMTAGFVAGDGNKQDQLDDTNGQRTDAIIKRISGLRSFPPKSAGRVARFSTDESLNAVFFPDDAQSSTDIGSSNQYLSAIRFPVAVIHHHRKRYVAVKQGQS